METGKNFSKAKILIVGDIMIDRYWWGNVERISPEAPVPVVRLQNSSLVAGGAANVAANVLGLGAKPFLVGAVGNDEESYLCLKLLEANRINPEYISKIENRPTTVKTRVIAHNQQVARIDQETTSEISENDAEKICLQIFNLLDQVDVIIVSDYAKGILTELLLERLITKCKSLNKIILVDPKGKNFQKYKNADIITPNQREIVEACALTKSDAKSIEEAAQKIISELNLQAVLVTRGEQGMMLKEKNQKTFFLEALARDVYDVTGAGDTVIATLAVAISSGLNYIEAVQLANIAAGLVVQQVGTTAIKIENLIAARENKINRN